MHVPNERRWAARDTRNELAVQLLLAAFMLLYYGALITDFSFYFFRSTPYGTTLNSMLWHLLDGRFDVDPDVVGEEGFLRGGRVYAYYGIVCAFIRLPLLAMKSHMMSDITPLSCVIAACLAGSVKIRTAMLVRRFCQPGPVTEGAFFLLVIAIVLGGAQVAYLRASIYQEVLFWAAAMVAGFVYCAVRGLLLGRFTASLLAGMALLAGLALLNRVSTGIGLYGAMGLLLAVLIAADARGNLAGFAARLVAAALSRRIVVAIAILLVFVVATGTVNFFRWGNPATFADFPNYIYNRLYPDRMVRTAAYGLFNIARVPFGLSYFFFPIWALQGADGKLLFQATQTRLFDVVELPPGSFLLTDLLPILFIALLLIAMKRRQLPEGIRLGPLVALAAGLALPGILMLMAISMNYRYRMEFAPEIDLLAFIGFAVAGINPASAARLRGCRHWLAAATLVSVLSAHGELLLYQSSDYGPSQDYVHHGMFDYYRQRIPATLREAGLMR